MKLHRSLLVPALAGVCLSVIAGGSYFVLRDPPGPSFSPALALAASSTGTEGSPTASPAGPARLPDFACASEPLHQEVIAWRREADQQAAWAGKRRIALRIEDANFDDASAAITTHPDPNDIPNLERKAAELAAVIEEKSAQWEKVLVSSVEEFQRTAPKNKSSCGEGLFYAILTNSLTEAGKLQAAGVDPGDERMRDVEARIKNMRSHLVASALHQEHDDLTDTRQTLEELQDPQNGIAAYMAIKERYLAARQKMDAAQRQYEVARMIPLPASRTKDWRVPQAAH